MTAESRKLAKIKAILARLPLSCPLILSTAIDFALSRVFALSVAATTAVNVPMISKFDWGVINLAQLLIRKYGVTHNV